VGCGSGSISGSAFVRSRQGYFASMSEENMRVARGIGEAFKAGDFDAVGAKLHPDIEWHEDPSFPESSVYRGIDAVASYSQQFRSEFSRINYEMVELIEITWWRT
jgi:ketosteroid isomerase-like protein